jgi:hypothetical protein
MKTRMCCLSLGLATLLLQTTLLQAAEKSPSKPNGDAKRESRQSRIDESQSVRTPASVTATPRADILAISRRVDELIESDCAGHDVPLNTKTGDELFVRRVYLDIIGRIPTVDEAREFLDSDTTDKRSHLIDRLLDSEGYVSHHFNYWADLLRVQSRMRYGPAQPYVDFVKTALRENRPYDVFVRELIAAEGYTWDNGAAGYYLRDAGMPLDNMSNTAQVFLGTQLVCAQCHNHPYDSWTQRQYYQLAAFTYGVETRDRNNPKLLEVRQMRRDGDIDRNVLQAAGQIMQQLNYRVNETDRALRLPRDYQYEDAKPGEQIDAATIFGDGVEIHEGDSPADVYARWMTAPDNPRFSTVIANRLWKRTMGRGLVEPIDDFKDGVDASNPELMTFLAEQMVTFKFDLKQYLRVLFNTQTYQREVTTREVTADETYYFPGPLLRRMSAEQLWDSLLTMTVPEIDERKGMVNSYGRRYMDGKELVEKPISEILVMAEQTAKARAAQSKFYEMTRDLQQDLRVASRTQDRDRVDELRDKMTKIRKKVYGREGEMMMERQRTEQRERQRETDPRWLGLSRELVRASETTSPARPGHFLQQFGQSDRETIENASTEATVPQILTLLNGPMNNQLTSRNSVLARKLADVTDPEERAELIFLTILSRRPSERERELAVNQLESDRQRGVSDVVWALINTRQFMFVQ